MNSPSIRRRSWSGWPVSLFCCGVLIVGVVSSRTLAQEKPKFDPRGPEEVLPPFLQRLPIRNGGALIHEANSLLKNVYREGEAPAEPQETSDFPHVTGSAGASPSLFQQAAKPSGAETLLTAQAPSADPTDAITPATKPTAPPEFLPRLSLSEERIQSSLNDSAEVAFTDTPLEEALKYLEDLHSVEIWLDKETLAAQQINTDQPVNLQISGVSVQSALHLMLEPLSLSLVIEDEVLKITTKARADKAIITRTYPVSDLFSTREEAEELVESLSCGLGLVQKSKEGPKSLAVSVPSAAIIARISRSQQDQLLQLLRDLREAKSLVPKRPVTAGETPRNGVRASDGLGSPKNPDAKLDEFSPGLRPDDFNPRPRLQPLQPEPQFDSPRESPPGVKPAIK